MVMMMPWLLCFSAYSKSMSHTIFHNVPTTYNSQQTSKNEKKGFINHFLRLLILAKFPADF